MIQRIRFHALWRAECSAEALRSSEERFRKPSTRSMDGPASRIIPALETSARASVLFSTSFVFGAGTTHYRSNSR
jgi:hypothetical protein